MEKIILLIISVSFVVGMTAHYIVSRYINCRSYKRNDDSKIYRGAEEP